MRIVEKRLPIGKWRVTLQAVDGISGHDITTVALKGLRDHRWRIRRATADEFYERNPADEFGNPTDTYHSLRGLPQMYFQRGNQIYLWPSPAAEWTLEIELTPKEKADAPSAT